MKDEEIKATRELATALLFVMRGFGMNPPAETSIPHRILQLCNEVERLDRALWAMQEQRDKATAEHGRFLCSCCTNPIDVASVKCGACVREDLISARSIGERLRTLAVTFPDDAIGEYCAKLVEDIANELAPERP